MHAGRIASSRWTRSETLWTGDGGRWVLSQLINQSRANALEPCAAERFMQLDGHGEDGGPPSYTLRCARPATASEGLFPFLAPVAATSSCAPPSAIGSPTVFLFLTVLPCALLFCSSTGEPDGDPSSLPPWSLPGPSIRCRNRCRPST
jgi:hypothetical protein